MEEIVAIRDIKYCHFLHKIFFINFPFVESLLMFDNKCSFDMDIGWDGISSYRRDAIQSPSHRTPQFAIAKAQRTQKKNPIDYFSRRINLCNKMSGWKRRQKNDHNFYMFRLHVSRSLRVHCVRARACEIYDSN